MRRIAFLLLSLLSPLLLLAQPLEVSISAKSAILMNAESGAILFEKHAHLPSYPASTTKVATALFLLDGKKLPLHQMVTVSAEAIRRRPNDAKEGEYPPHWDSLDGSKMGVLKGEVIPAHALLHGLLLMSGNDAANTLAEAACGSVPQFLDEMNGYLASLGCKQTRFMNPHGIHHSEHMTTAYDLALMTRTALKIPAFRQMVAAPAYLKPRTNKHPSEEIVTSNALLQGGRYYYPKAIGVKTGYTSAAGYTLVAAAEHEGRTLIAVLLGCANRNVRYVEAIRLFEAAFAEQKKTRHCFGISQLFTHEVPGGKIALRAHLASPLLIAFYPSEEPTCKAFIHWHLAELPIRKGQKVGEVHLVNDQGVLLQKGDLVAKEAVEATWWSRMQGLFGKKSGATQ